MKNFKKIITSIFVLGVSLCCFCAKAEKITNVDALRQSVEESVINSGDVRTKKSDPKKKGMSLERKRMILKVCSDRIEFLTRMQSRTIAKSDVASAVGSYLGRYHIRGDMEEAIQLRMSGNPTDLKYNLSVLIGVYEDIQRVYSDFESVDKAPDKVLPQHKQFLHKREGRKGHFCKGAR